MFKEKISQKFGGHEGCQRLKMEFSILNGVKSQ